MKVLIADDEMHIRNGLKKGIPWKALGIDEVLTAEDGEAALEICREKRPEIIVTDIRMPGLDGLSLTQSAGEHWGLKKAVILSGYSEFEYAKRAIGLGVADYLLKPVKTDELTALIEKIVKEIHEEKYKEEAARQEKILDILEGRLPAEEIKTLLCERKGIKYRKENFSNNIVLGVLKGDVVYGKKACGTDDLREYIEEERGITFLVREKLSSVFLLQLCSRQDRGDYLSRMSSCLRRINKRHTDSAGFSLGVSSAGMVRDVARLYKQACLALEHRLYLGAGSCMFYEQIPGESEKIYPVLSLDKSAIEESVLMLQVEELNRHIHKHFVYLREKRCTDKQTVQELCLAVKNTVFDVMKEKGVDIAGILDRNQELFQSQMDFSTLVSYEKWLCDYCYLLLAGLRDLTGKHYSTIISRAVDYINQHYSEEITLKGLAEEVNKSPSYFSCIFKKEMGLNFNEYLNQVRIRKAKELLRMPDMVIYEVAEKTGFHDYKYFTKVFKKLCGCSPSEYSGRKK